MTDEQHELRRINWTEVFSFTHIFKSFKMAIHPSKLGLALAAVVIIFCAGWVMDQVWAVGGQHVYPGEVYDHFAKPSWQFEKDKEDRLDRRVDRAAALVAEAEGQKYSLATYRLQLPRGPLQDAFREVVAEKNKGVEFTRRSADAITKDKDYSELLSEAETFFDGEIDRIDDILDSAEDKAEETIKEEKNEERREEAEEKLEEDLQTAKQRISERKVSFAREAQDIRGGTIFASLLDYELRCLSNAIMSVRHGNILGGLSEYRATLAAKAIPPMAVSAEQLPKVSPPTPADERAGFVRWGLLAVHGLCWLICQHWVYALIFLLASMAVVAFFGGAVHRIAALHFAREEKISVGQALKFSCSKFLSFFTAPLIPLVAILVLGLFLAFGGFLFGWLLGLIPFVGNIILGLLFFLAIIMGLLIAFLLVGLLGGFPMMYPTIAVEGSDSFDAMSRSFSYIFARPWRAAFYGLVSVVYGAITYLFVRFFAFIALAATHAFVKWGVFGGGERLHQEADKLDVMWQAPTFDSLFGPFNWGAMNMSQSIGAWLIGVWVFLVAATVFAYLLSYAASSTTVIYYLLRRKVDATDLDDVYVEELEEEEPFPAEEESAPPEGEGEGEGEAEPKPEPEAEPPAEEEKPSEGEEGGEEDTKDK